MTRKFSLDEVKNIFSKDNYVLLSSEYFGVNAPLEIACDKGHVIKLRLSDFKQGHRCKHCFNETRGDTTRYSLEQIKKIMLDVGEKDVIVSDFYRNNDSDLLVECHRCGKRYKTCWDKIKSGYRHDSCSKKEGRRKQLKKTITNDYNLLSLFPEICFEWDYSKNKSSPEEYSPYSGQSAYWICSNCGHKWESVINNRSSLGNSCPVCNSSKGEKRIREFLDSNGIRYNLEFTFDNCINKRKLPFDFYLFDYNLCIEYDGSIHFKDKFNNPQEFKNVKKRDKIKTKYCKDNNVNLLRIPYWNFNGIEKILQEYLFGKEENHSG